MTTIRDIIPKLQIPGSDTDIRRLPTVRKKYPNLYARILFLCQKSQLKLLLHIWNDRFPSPDILANALRTLTNKGLFIDLMDGSSKHALHLIEQEYKNACQC